MPRYNNVDIISFTTIDGKSYPVRDIREISTQTLSYEIDKNEDDLLDEVASRQEVFGDLGEGQSWRIFDLNITELTQVNFDTTKIKRLKVPL